jgi:hypothetical protein
MKDEDKPGTCLEFEAWDRYAAAALHGYMEWQKERPVSAQDAAEDAAKLADALLLERRKRYSPI